MLISSWEHKTMTTYTVFTTIFFSMLAFDMCKRIPHSAQIAIDGHLVTHFSPSINAFLQQWLDARFSSSTDRERAVQSLYVVCTTLASYFSALIALHGPRKQLHMAFLSICMSVSYFISQRDSFQHHFLLCLTTFVLALIPSNASVKQLTFPLTLVRLQLAILYFWTAIAKLDRDWFSGAELAAIMRGNIRVFLDSILESASNQTKQAVFITLAVATIVVELCLAWSILRYTSARARMITLFLGVSLHMTLDSVGLYIEYFSTYMWLLLAIALVSLPPLPQWVLNGAKRLEEQRSVALSAVLPMAALIMNHFNPPHTLPPFPLIGTSITLLMMSYTVVLLRKKAYFSPLAALLVFFSMYLHTSPLLSFLLHRGSELSHQHRYAESLATFEYICKNDASRAICPIDTQLAITHLRMRTQADRDVTIELLLKGYVYHPGDVRLEYGLAVAWFDKAEHIQDKVSQQKVKRAALQGCLTVQRFEVAFLKEEPTMCKFTRECDRKLSLVHAQRRTLGHLYKKNKCKAMREHTERWEAGKERFQFDLSKFK